jgi:hypothetical protein
MKFSRQIHNLKCILSFDKEPILIGGCGRTGTSLMTAILDAHPNIYSHPFETNIFAAKRKYKTDWLNHQEMKFRFYNQMWKVELKPGAKRWCEKTPRNVQHLDSIFNEFKGKVKVVLMIRDGRDVVTSKHPLREGYYVTIERWMRDTQKTLDYLDNPKVLVVPYQALVGYFDFTIHHTLHFLDEAFDQRLLDFAEHSGVQSHDAFHGNHLQPIYTGAIRKWEREEFADRVAELMDTPGAADLIGRVDAYTKQFIKKAI